MAQSGESDQIAIVNQDGGDVAGRGASNRVIKSRSSIVTEGGGYVAHSNSSVNHF